MSKRLYVVFCHDDRVSPMIRVFEKKEVAIHFAKWLITQYNMPDVCEEESADRWLYYCSIEDVVYVFVEEVTLNAGCHGWKTEEVL